MIRIMTFALLSLLCGFWGQARADQEPACGKGTTQPEKGPTPSVRPPPPSPGDGPLLVQLFVMSKCPYGSLAERAIAPALVRLGKSVRFRLEFIGQRTETGLSSMHGQSEIEGNKIQACAAQLFPDKYMKLVDCMNEDMPAIPEGWDRCAQDLGLDADSLAECFRGERGTALLAASFERAQLAGVQGSPTLLIGGKVHMGPREEGAYFKAICRAFTKDRPPVCASVPPVVEVPLLLVFDSRCKKCRHHGLVAELGAVFPGLKVTRADYATPQGRKVYDRLKLGLLPVVLIGPEVKRADNYKILAPYLEPAGDRLALKLRGEWDPTREICDNGQDDDGDDKADCDDSDCVAALLCRKEAPAQLEVFVMSQCPYALRALDAMRTVLGRLGQELVFRVHYIVSADGDGFKALHGQPEVDENIRQLCAHKHYSENQRYLDYIWCRSGNIRSDEWQECAKGNGMAPEKIESCAKGAEGRALLRADMSRAKELGVGASPTWLVNNRHLFHGIDPQIVIDNFCKHNPALAGCKQ